MSRERELLSDLVRTVRKLQRTSGADLPSPFNETERRAFGTPTSSELAAVERDFTNALASAERYLKQTDPKNAPS